MPRVTGSNPKPRGCYPWACCPGLRVVAVVRGVIRVVVAGGVIGVAVVRGVGVVPAIRVDAVAAGGGHAVIRLEAVGRDLLVDVAGAGVVALVAEGRVVVHRVAGRRRRVAAKGVGRTHEMVIGPVEVPYGVVVVTVQLVAPPDLGLEGARGRQ